MVTYKTSVTSDVLGKEKNMEHIVQFGVSIDDGAIQRSVLASATQRIIDAVERDTKRGYYGQESYLYDLMKEEVKRVIDENKERIINKATKELTRNMSKTKAVREAINATIDRLGDDCE